MKNIYKIVTILITFIAISSQPSLFRMKRKGNFEDTRQRKRRKLNEGRKEDIGGEKEKKITTCSICLDRILPNDETKELKCKHIFHKSCAERWLSEHNTCPTCRNVEHDRPIPRQEPEFPFEMLAGMLVPPPVHINVYIRLPTTRQLEQTGNTSDTRSIRDRRRERQRNTSTGVNHTENENTNTIQAPPTQDNPQEATNNERQAMFDQIPLMLALAAQQHLRSRRPAENNGQQDNQQNNQQNAQQGDQQEAQTEEQ